MPLLSYQFRPKDRHDHVTEPLIDTWKSAQISYINIHLRSGVLSDTSTHDGLSYDSALMLFQCWFKSSLMWR